MAKRDLGSDYVKKEELDDITTCCICTEVYTDPKALPCIHTFCMKCIQETGLKTNKGPGDDMPCPICRRLFKIPREGFPGLPKHFFMERLIEVSTASDQSASSGSLCDARVEENKEDTGPMTKYRDKPKLVKKIDLGHSVWSLAILNKELFIAAAEDGAIFVYDPVSYKRLRTIHLEGSVRPRDIAACQEKNCLFVVDLVSGPSLFCIDKRGKILKQWQVPYEPHNLSVMPSGNILLTCNARILIYNSDGIIIQDLRLDANALDMSWQTILLRSGNYIACQGWMHSKHHRVLNLSPQGAILRSFGSERQNSKSHLSNPVYMAIDRDELILVADSGNNRVVLLSQGLVFLKELLNKDDGVTEPYRVLLDEASRLLYVGTNKRQLLIFNIFK